MDKLKLCPFCGGKAETFHIPENDELEKRNHPLWNWRNPGMWVVGCSTPVCIGNMNNVSLLFFSEESAVLAWNKRADRKEAEG